MRGGPGFCLNCGGRLRRYRDTCPTCGKETFATSMAGFLIFGCAMPIAVMGGYAAGNRGVGVALFIGVTTLIIVLARRAYKKESR